LLKEFLVRAEQADPEQNGSAIGAEGFWKASADLAEDGEWLRRPDAASRLGVTERTLDNRIASGKLQKRVSESGHVEVWVPLKGEDEQIQKALVILDRYNSSLSSQLHPLVEKYSELADKYAQTAEENGRLKAKLEEAEARIQSLTAPPLSESEAQALTIHPWWQFWKSH
jgi:hypothetical protein